ncbi:MAG: SMC family ATPase [Anaerolineaceae bacterium]|nr:SMC family ATPase [Anaerolineaceae bacterium]
MIPVQLKIKGFLSYREPVELDFTGFDTACVIGRNGAGKSSLLDAMTWALFGKARQNSDDDLINIAEDEAFVSLVFDYEGLRYQVERSKKRGSTKQMYLNVYDEETGQWKTLTESRMTDTQSKLERILCMDYNTFTNASFFLQGKADQFAKQRPSQRKETLTKILELEIWEAYKVRAGEARKKIESRVSVIDDWLPRIYEHLAKESALKKEFKQIEQEMSRLEKEVNQQDKLVQTLRKQRELADKQQDQVLLFRRNTNKVEQQLNMLAARIGEQREEEARFHRVLESESEVIAAFESWQTLIKELEALDHQARSFNEMVQERQQPLLKIREEQTRLESERNQLLRVQDQARKAEAARVELAEKIRLLEDEVAKMNEEVNRFPQLEDEMDDYEIEGVELREEIQRIKLQRGQLQARMKTLRGVESAECPLCGQPLTREHRNRMLAELDGEQQHLEQTYNEYGAKINEYVSRISALKSEIKRLRDLQTGPLLVKINHLSDMRNNLGQMEERLTEWNNMDAPRLKQLEDMLEGNQFALEARETLSAIDDRMAALGYDPRIHEQVRAQEREGRKTQEALREIDRARAALEPLQRAIADNEAQLGETQMSLEEARKSLEASEAYYSELSKQGEDYAAEFGKLNELRLMLNRMHTSRGAIQQQIVSLDEDREKKKELEAEKEGLLLKKDRYRQLEEAFGTKGIPTLLIEQAIPEIEELANDVLSRLSSNGMMVHFKTQRAYRDTSREDLRETLDIIISDNAGVRDYEMYSGGEAFRVNFAIRLALSRILARRAGARLQTLVIDEGFGSQDAEGVQRLVETINVIREDFAKVLVITHLETLKESFPSQIEVEKTLTGSKVQVLA